MPGIYIHIPFCKQACHYCNFHFSTSTKAKNDFLEALLKEIVFQKGYLQTNLVETIYFGGGTPSLLTSEELQSIMQALNKQFNIASNAEITLEANPDDITLEKLEAWKNSSINRLSIGVQSFFEEDLLWMNRAHNAQQAIDCIEDARKIGFYNLTIDLIYGTPTLTDEKWQHNVQLAIDLKIPHVSCYALTVETKTALHNMIKKKTVPNVKNEDQARQFLLLMDWLLDAGYEHYEISNFAKPGWRSRHNSAYWQGKHYIGLGPSAHSFNGYSRQWNIANNALYIQSLQRNEMKFEIEILSTAQKVNEYIMTSLRTMEGLDLQKISNEFNENTSSTLKRKSEKFLKQQLMKIDNNHLQLTNEGKLFADGIAADLFVETVEKIRIN